MRISASALGAAKPHACIRSSALGAEMPAVPSPLGSWARCVATRRVAIFCGYTDPHAEVLAREVVHAKVHRIVAMI